MPLQPQVGAVFTKRPCFNCPSRVLNTHFLTKLARCAKLIHRGKNSSPTQKFNHKDDKMNLIVSTFTAVLSRIFSPRIGGGMTPALGLTRNSLAGNTAFDPPAVPFNLNSNPLPTAVKVMVAADPNPQVSVPVKIVQNPLVKIVSTNSRRARARTASGWYQSVTIVARHDNLLVLQKRGHRQGPTFYRYVD